MKNKIVLGCLAGLLFVSVIAIVGVKPAKTAQGEQIDVQSWVWGLANNQALSVCLNNAPAPDSRPTEQFSFIFMEIKNHLGQSILNTGLTVPAGEFRCAKFSQPQLVAAGLIPEPSGRTQFLIFLSGPNGVSRSAEIGGGQLLTTGSIETFDVADGQSRIYIGIHWRH